MNARDTLVLFKQFFKAKHPEISFDISNSYFYIYNHSRNQHQYFGLRFKYVENKTFRCNYKAINSKGNPSSHNIQISLDDFEKCHEEIMKAIEKSNAYLIHMNIERNKQKQINSLNDIIIAGMLQKCPMLSKAFEAKTRGAKNFCKKTFNNNTGTLRIDAKLTIKNSSKLVKVFEALEEALKD